MLNNTEGGTIMKIQTVENSAGQMTCFLQQSKLFFRPIQDIQVA